MKIAVLYNPSAGDQELSRRKLLSLLRDAGYRPRFFSLKEEAWKEKHALKKAAFVVVAGGDGSVRKAVLELHDRKLPFALLPLGTANNICTCLGIEGSPRKIIQSWSVDRRRKMDLGVIKGPWGESLFVESVGAGLIGRTITIMAAVEAATDHQIELREDRLHRDSSVMLALAHELQPISLAVSVNGRTAKKNDFLLLEVMNISRAGPGLELAPSADPSDGFLNLVTATVLEREKLKQSLADKMGGLKTRARLTQQNVRSLRLELSDGELRLDDKVVLEFRAKKATKRSPAKNVSVEISLRRGAFEILSAKKR